MLLNECEEEQSNFFNSKDWNSLFDLDNSLTIQYPYPYNPCFGLNIENKIDEFKFIEEESTSVSNKIIEIPISQNDEDAYMSIPRNYFLNEIKRIFLDNNIHQKFINIIDKYKNDFKLKEAEKEITIIHKGRNTNKENKKKENFGKFQSGRKRKDDVTERKHGKKDADNIIKKIKSKFIDFLMKYVNNIININLKKRKGEAKIYLKKLNYKKYIDSIKRKDNLEFLQRSIKDILSYEISSKYLKFPKDWNLKNINSILKCNKEYDNIINYIFNMKFNEWIDIFLLKKKANNHEIIEKYLPTVNELLEDILSKNDEYYLSMFIFYLYNYERWFYNRNSRNRKKNNKNNC